MGGEDRFCPIYASPERFSDKMDMWSFGACMLEALFPSLWKELCGKYDVSESLPEHHKNVLDTIDKLVQYNPVGKHNEMERELLYAIRECLTKNHKERSPIGAFRFLSCLESLFEIN